MHVDPTPFEPRMPEPVRAALTEARSGWGPLIWWLQDDGSHWNQVGTCCALLRRHSFEVDPQILGWIAGIAMFGDDQHQIPKCMKNGRVFAPAPFALEAFAAGIEAGVQTTPRQWKGVEQLVAMAKVVPDRLCAVLPLGLASDQALARGTALKLARQAGERATEEIAKARGRATGKALRRLDEALAALQAGQPAAAGEGEEGDGAAEPAPAASRANEQAGLLSRLLSAWRQTRDPRLREPISRLGVELARKRGPLKARSKGELEGAWTAMAAAKDPCDVDRLLETPWPGVWKAARERVRALAEHPHDPRIATGLLRVAGQYRSKGSNPLHRAVAALIEATADPGCLPDLERTRASRGNGLELVYDRALAACRAAQPKQADEALLAEAKAAGGAEAKDLDQLWTWFWADPADPNRRLVLADALQAAGDPRGEFIGLQCAQAEGRGDDAKVRRRAAELLEANGEAWCGPLGGLEKPTRRFERGFLVAARSTATTEELERAQSAREWRTLEELTIAAEGDWTDLVHRMPCLRTLAFAHDKSAEAIAQSAPMPALRALAGLEYVPPARARAFPNLAVLAGTWPCYRYGVELIAMHVLLARLRASGVSAVVFKSFQLKHLAKMLSAWHRDGPPELRVVTGWSTGFGAEGWRVRVRRGSRRADVAWCGGPHWRDAAPDVGLDALAAAGFEEVGVFVGKTGEGLEELARRYEPRGMKVVAADDTIALAEPPKSVATRGPAGPTPGPSPTSGEGGK